MDCEPAPESQESDRAPSRHTTGRLYPGPRPFANGQERCSFPLWYGPTLSLYHDTPGKPGLTRLQLGPIREPDTTHHIRRIVHGPPCPLGAFTSRLRAGLFSNGGRDPRPSLGSETGSGSVSTLQVTINRVFRGVERDRWSSGGPAEEGHPNRAEYAGRPAVPKSLGFGTSVPRRAADIDFEETADPSEEGCMHLGQAGASGRFLKGLLDLKFWSGLHRSLC
jgi:hypothetical protein